MDKSRFTNTTAPSTKRLPEIAAFLEIDVRAAFRALEAGVITGAKKEGRTWRFDRVRYERSFNSVAA